MLQRTVAVMVVVACFTVVHVQPRRGVHDDAGGPPAVSARLWAFSGPQLTDKTNHVELKFPDHAPMSTLSHRVLINPGKRRRKCIDGSCHVHYRDYRRAIRRSRKSLKSSKLQRQPWRPKQVESVDDLERQLRQYQARRIAEEIARLREIHARNRDRPPTKKHRRHRRRRRRRFRAGRKTTNVESPKSISLPS